jgi:chromosomal replication initiator protein
MTNEVNNLVCQEFNVTLLQLKSKSRKRVYVVPRHVCMFFLKTKTQKTHKEIGKYYGGRDHSSVIHAIHTINDLMDSDKVFAQTILRLGNELYLVPEEKPKEVLEEMDKEIEYNLNKVDVN